jgi:CheY-like chemotaxis protein
MKTKSINKDSDVLCQRYIELEGMKILLAEDNMVNIVIAKRILSRWNIEVTVATNGLIAVDKVKNGHYDLIITDVDMPVMDGLTASIAIRKFNLETPIIVLTSNSDYKIRDGFIALGIEDIIYKPLDLEELYGAILKHALAKVA